MNISIDAISLRGRFVRPLSRWERDRVRESLLLSSPSPQPSPSRERPPGPVPRFVPPEPSGLFPHPALRATFSPREKGKGVAFGHRFLGWGHSIGRRP